MEYLILFLALVIAFVAWAPEGVTQAYNVATPRGGKPLGVTSHQSFWRTIMSAKDSTLTAARLRRAFFYNPDTGEFVSRIERGRVHVGMSCGTINKVGYVVIRLDSVLYAAHRLAWLYQTGQWPDGEIDHKDGNRVRNVFSNLRDVTRSTNNENRRRGEFNSTSPLLGVSFCKFTSKWRAQIAHHGMANKNLGRFDTEEEAHAVYLKAKRDIHAGCTI